MQKAAATLLSLTLFVLPLPSQLRSRPHTMPYETVREEVVQTRRVRVCARCRNPIPEAANRQTINTVGSVGGSLGASLGGSILVGSLLGPIGAIGGAIAGSIAGARAGRDVSNKVAEAVENQQDSMCQACRKITDSYNGGQRLGHGERIGESDNKNPLEWMKQSVNNIAENFNKKPDDKNSGGGGSQTSGIL